MPTFQWDSSYSVDHAEIDKQHQRFFELIDELDGALMSGGASEVSGATRASVEALREYSQQHFADEERYMAELGYPDLQTHQFEHSRLARRISDFRDDLYAGRIVLGTEVAKTMTDWLADHILGSDKKYAQFSARNPSK